MSTPIDVNRGLARDSRGSMIWDVRDVLIETSHGPFIERQLIGQPNGGVIHRQGPGGIGVFMYNDDPGVFLNERGAPVSERFAEAAGFDVQSLGRQRRKKVAMEAAGKAVEAEFSQDAPNSYIIKERGEYRLVELAPGHFAIHFIEPDGTGSPLSATAMPRKAAETLFDQLAPPVE